MSKTVERFARVCEVCNKGMNAGYYADGLTYCSNECLAQDFTDEEWDEAVEEDFDAHYYTEWDVPSEIKGGGEFYDKDGNEYKAPTKTEVPCPYCMGSGTGSYWLHDLSDVVDAPCHACEDGLIPLVSFPMVLREAGYGRRESYREVYPESESW